MKLDMFLSVSFLLSFSFCCCLSSLSVVQLVPVCLVMLRTTATVLFPFQNERLHLYTCCPRHVYCTVTPHRQRRSVYLLHFKLQGVTAGECASAATRLASGVAYGQRVNLESLCELAFLLKIEKDRTVCGCMVS